MTNENQETAELAFSCDSDTKSLKFRIVSFIWQHILLLGYLFLMTFGVALAIRSNLGSSVISSIPMAMMLAGEAGKVPALTIGDYTNIMNIILVFMQILILRKKFEKVQLFQLIIGTLFGWLLDLNMFLTAPLTPDSLTGQILLQIGGCIILGAGIAFEIKCGSVTMPGEGVPAAISKLTGTPFPKAKIAIDITLVAIAVALGFIFFGTWLINVIGPGTLFAMVFVGMVVRYVDRRIGWFDKLLSYHPGFRRYAFGLLRFINRRRQ